MKRLFRKPTKYGNPLDTNPRMEGREGREGRTNNVRRNNK